MATFLKAAAGLALGLAVFAGLVVLLVGVNLTQRLDEPEVYAAAFSETGAYDRIYDEVLADEELRDRTGRMLGGMNFAVHDEAVDMLRQVMPPEYLREQMEANIGRLTAYLRHERDDLEIYVDLQGPLERVEPAALEQVHQYIDELEVAEPATSGCSPSSLQQLATAAAEPYSRLSQGQLPETAPSLEILSRECREREFDRWFGLVLNDPVMSTQVSRVLGNEVEELRRTFIEGDTRGFLKAGADPLVEPVIEGTVAEVRRNLPPDHRIDLLDWLTSQPVGPTRTAIDAWAESLRDVLSTVNGPARNIALVVVVIGSLLLALVHLPRPVGMLRWPGVTLLAGGGACLVLGFVLNSVAPGTARRAVVSFAPSSAEFPAPAVNLAGDIAETFVRQATAGFIPATVVVMAIGGVLIAGSLYHEHLASLVRRALGKS